MDDLGQGTVVHIKIFNVRNCIALQNITKLK